MSKNAAYAVSLNWNTAFSPISALLVGHDARFAASSRLELGEKQHSIKRILQDGLHEMVRQIGFFCAQGRRPVGALLRFGLAQRSRSGRISLKGKPDSGERLSSSAVFD